MFIIGINASPYPNGNTAKGLHTALTAMGEAGIRHKMDVLTQVIDLGDIPHVDGRRTEKEPFKDRIANLPEHGDLQQIVRTILEADGIIFATPVNAFSASTRVMALLSWLQVVADYPEYKLAGKVAAYMSVFEECGGQSANMAMLSPASHSGFILPPASTHFRNINAKGSEGDWQNLEIPLVGLNVFRMIYMLQAFIIPSGMWSSLDSRIMPVLRAA